MHKLRQLNAERWTSVRWKNTKADLPFLALALLFHFPSERKVKQTKRNETLAYNKIGCESVSGNRDKNVIRAE